MIFGFILFFVLFIGYRHATSRLAKFAVSCGALMIPAVVYNWIYGWPSWSPDQPAVVTVFAGLAGLGLFMGFLCGGIALIRDAWKDKSSPR